MVRIKKHHWQGDNTWATIIEHNGVEYQVEMVYTRHWVPSKGGYYIGYLKVGDTLYRAGYSDYKNTAKYIFRGLIQFLESRKAYVNKDIVLARPLPSELSTDNINELITSPFLRYMYPEYLEALEKEYKNRIS